MARPLDILQSTLSALDAGRPMALCAIVATRGSTPQPAGTLVCVDADARMTGSLGGGCVEADIRNQASKALAAGHHILLRFTLDQQFALDEGMVCGGTLDVAVHGFRGTEQVGPLREAARRLVAGEDAMLPLHVNHAEGRVAYRVHLEPVPRLLIAGGGHIGRVVADLALLIGFDVSVFDDREAFANPDRFPPPMLPVVGDIGASLAAAPIDARTYVVIVTRGHLHDQRALAAVLSTSAGYIGMVGSRRKIDLIYRDLLTEGATQAQLDRVCAPIGLDIGAVTAEEIAVSIVAQLVATRRRVARPIVEGPIPLAPGRT